MNYNLHCFLFYFIIFLAIILKFSIHFNKIFYQTTYSFNTGCKFLYAFGPIFPAQCSQRLSPPLSVPSKICFITSSMLPDTPNIVFTPDSAKSSWAREPIPPAIIHSTPWALRNCSKNPGWCPGLFITFLLKSLPYFYLYNSIRRASTKMGWNKISICCYCNKHNLLLDLNLGSSEYCSLKISYSFFCACSFSRVFILFWISSSCFLRNSSCFLRKSISSFGSGSYPYGRWHIPKAG